MAPAVGLPTTLSALAATPAPPEKTGLPVAVSSGPLRRSIDKHSVATESAHQPDSIEEPAAPLATTTGQETNVGIQAWWSPEKGSCWNPLPGRARNGRRLRVAIVTENFLPKVDGVTRTLARLIEHLAEEGHEVLLCGPDTGMTSYAGFRVLGTWGVPLVIYPGLKLNFARPAFLRELKTFAPDIVHFVDPIWLGAQMVPLVQSHLPHVPLVASYHTNIAVYAGLYGVPWLERAIWSLTRTLHTKCEYTLCPSPSTATLLDSQQFSNVALWPRGVDTTVFSPYARDEKLRRSWGCVEDISYIFTPSPDTFGAGAERSPPPAYEAVASMGTIPESAVTSFALPPPAVEAVASRTLEQQTQGNSTPLQPNATDTTTHAAAASRNEPSVVVLYVGRLSWEKNLRLLVAAYSQLAPAVRAKSKLVFVGDGPARSALEVECSQRGLSALFLGHQRGAALAACYASADIFAFPSYTETFGQVVLEALASGLPVVGLEADGTADLVRHENTGLLLSLENIIPGQATNTAKPAIDRAANPGAIAFASVMRPDSESFTRAVALYSQLLSSLIEFPAARTAMGQTAATAASRCSWREAMDCAVDGYHASIASFSERKALSTKPESVAQSTTMPAPAIADRPPPTRLLRPRNLFLLTAIAASCALTWSFCCHSG